MDKKTVVKRKGHKEEFDEKKAYGSVYWACKSSHLHGKQCEEISEKTIEALKKEIKDHGAVSSDSIFKFISMELGKHNKDAAYMYKTHRDIS
ncbi:MAG: ATP cone domain-containing protein [archaeon]|nr:ATP cone domain-containing protein [archaeon]